MIDFEPYRASQKTFEDLQSYLTRWSQNKSEILKKAKENSIGSVRRRLKSLNLHELWEREQNELYLTLHADCRLYVGNSGGKTKCLGDLRTIDLRETAHIINELPGNRDYSAYYDTERLPSMEELDLTLAALPQDLVYGDMESVIYRGLAELGLPTKIL